MKIDDKIKPNFFDKFLDVIAVVGTVVFFLVVLALVCSITPLIFMLLWNWLAPMFWVTAPVLTFWQSVGIVVLLSLIGSILKPSSNNDCKTR